MFGQPTGLLLDHRRSIANPAAGAHIIDTHPNEVAVPKLAVDGQIEHRKIALAAANANCPDVLRLQRTLLADQATLFQGSSGSEGVGFSAEMFVSRRSRPLPPQRQIAVDRPGTISRKGAERRSGPLRDCDGAAAIQRIAGTGREYPSVGSAAPGAGTSGIFFSVTTFMTLFLLWPSFRLSIGARPFKAKPTSTQTASPDSPPP